MHVYFKGDPAGETWEVGFFRPDGEFHTVKVVKDEIQAASLVNFLNGGNQAITLIAEIIEQE